MSTKSELRPVSALRRRMIADLQLRGLSERTQDMVRPRCTPTGRA